MTTVKKATTKAVKKKIKKVDNSEEQSFLADFILTDEAENGKFFNISGDIEFKIRSDESRGYNKDLATIRDSLPDSLDGMEEEEAFQYLKKTGSLLVTDWRGFEGIEYSPEKCTEFFEKSDLLYGKVRAIASNFSNFKDLKKS